MQYAILLVDLLSLPPKYETEQCTTLSFPKPAQKQKKAEKEDPASSVENVKDGTHLDNNVKDYVNEHEIIEAL